MKVLFLTYDGLTDPLGQSQILPYLVGLSSKGHNISIVSLEKQSAFKRYSADIQYTCNKTGIHWNHLPFPENGGRISQYKTSREFRNTALSIALDQKIDLIHCRSYPSAMAGRFVQKKTNIPWIFDIRGFWIDERKEGKIWNFSNPVVCLMVFWLRHIEKRLYSNANAVVSLTHKAKDIIIQKFLTTNPNKLFSVIPCCADYSIFNPMNSSNKQQLRSELDLPDSEFILAYLGSLGTWYMLQEMLDFFAVLLTQKPGAHFLFISNEAPEKILRLSRKAGIPDTSIIIRSANRDEVPKYLASSNCGISFIRPSFSKQASSPVKWGETLACGIPLIVNNIGDADILKDELKGFIVTDDFSTRTYHNLIDQLHPLENLSPDEISHASFNKYDLVHGIHTYDELYKKTAGKKILFIASHRPGRAPNQRFRFEQYFPYFESQGYHCVLSHLIDKSDDLYIYRPGHLFKKAWFLFGKSIIRRCKDLKHLKNYDLIYIAREALMSRSIFFEKRFLKSKAKLVYDFDDSIWLTNVSSANRWFHWMKNPSKIGNIISMSAHVLAGNQYLANYAHQFSDQVTVIPTTLDTDDFQPIIKSKNASDPLVIGWTGSITTIPHFEFIIPALLRIKEKYGKKVKFEVIGEPDFYHAGLDLIGKAWSLEDEKELLSTFDIGIMPLPDDEWTRGKCGFKGLLCMSLGIPVIMSPVGVNNEIIQDGENGLLTSTEDEWVQKLSILIDSEEIRTLMALKGRQTVVDHYSMNRWKETYLNVFNTLTNYGSSR